MSQLDELLARSRSPGRLVERRAFTLSRDKAIEKQREFALRHPQQYVLELVQGAVFAGATYIAVDTRPDAMLVAWVGGRAFEGPELENLFDWLFADRGDLRWRHLVQLAIGVNALLQRRPRALRIESGDGTRAVRLDLDANGSATLGVPSEPIGGTYLYAEHDTGWLSRFASSTATTAEQALVEEKCLYTPVPILLNGTAPFGYRGSRHIEIFGARAQEYFDEGGRRGVVAVHASERAPVGFRMVVGGVWISTLRLAELSDRRLLGVVCDDALRKTADQSDIVQDHRYVEMLHAVEPHATRLLRRLDGPGYRPPALPPIPRVAEVAADRPQADAVQAEPLPDPIPSLHPRAPCTLEELRSCEGPVFRVEPHHVERLGRALDPHRFGWRILVLTEGQARTLLTEVPSLPLHRLTSKADVDFVRRIVERGIRIREHAVAAGTRRLVLRLHLEGPMPDWGQGQRGVPYCVVDDDAVVAIGAADLELPRLSVLVTSGGSFDAGCVELILRHAPALDPPPALLAALLAGHAVPQLGLAGDAVRLGISLPVDWPAAMLGAPLAETPTGPITLSGLAASEGTDGCVEVPELAELLALDRLEERVGYGHLTNRQLEAQPLFGAGRVGDRWLWLEDPGAWADPALHQLVWVGATFAPRERDERWQPGVRPAPELVGACRVGADAADWTDGWSVLFEGLQRVEADRSWAAYARAPVTAGRVEGLGRLALVHLAGILGRDTAPLLVPSDGGGRRSLSELRTHRAARVVARRGVRLAEPWTFAVTRDELGAIAADGRPRLRYDDDVEVWRSLPEAERGWLVRQEVRAGGLRGWIGLRCPHDPTTGVLLRSTGELVALSDLERSVPCHGLLWPEDGAGVIGVEQRRLAQLAGLRLYQGLGAVLAEDRDPERLDAARRYATTFVLLSHRRAGKLLGTALELARRVEVADGDGRPWGTLEGWLDAPAEGRPRLADELVPDEDPTELPPAPPGDDPLGDRLRDALGPTPLLVGLAVVERRPHADPITLDDARSHRGRVSLALNSGHPLVQQALAGPGVAREVILVELVRRICAWAEPLGVRVDLASAQQVLLAQRLGSRRS